MVRALSLHGNRSDTQVLLRANLVKHVDNLSMMQTQGYELPRGLILDPLRLLEVNVQ